MMICLGVLWAVISLSKLKISKAIHNCLSKDENKNIAVISLSKLKISKAIHNQKEVHFRSPDGCYQFVKVKNFESNSQH